MRHQRFPNRKTPLEAGRAALAALGADDAVHRGLAALSLDARGALVASAIERFDPIDVETILGAPPAATRHTLAEARNRYLQFAGGESDEQGDESMDQSTGELAGRIQRVAARAFSTGDAHR